jgi:pimeloyl-ACP methyl ester carboxylesterase
MRTSVVLVHGAWHGAWCFDRVVPLLLGAGVQAVAIDLPGHGEDDGAFTDLHGDAHRVGEVLDAIGGDVILLGHSYGGAVITEAGVHPSVRHLVYVSALALDGEETCVATAVEETAPLSFDGRPNLFANIAIDVNDVSTLDSAAAATCLYNGCNAETVQWGLARIGPQPMGNFRQTPSAVAWRTRPSTYVICSEDLVIHPGLQRVLSGRCTERLEWPTGHSPFASDPGLLSALLARLATGGLAN